LSAIALYYLAEGFYEQYNAGIVRKEQETILRSAGFRPLWFKHSEKQSYFFKIIRIIRCFTLAFSLPANSLVVFHFPFQARIYKWLLSLLSWRRIKTVALIIDIDGVRDRDEKELAQEITQLKKFTQIVAHNEAMKKLLLQYIPDASIHCIQIFDYPFEGSIATKKLSNTICFAGNIKKSAFTCDLENIDGVQFNIYGLGYNAGINNSPAIVYKGAVDANLLPVVIEGSFGLVWDGDSIEKCDDYLRYNNPHKFSLYLAAGLPVIVWKESALAAFVEEKGIGISVGSLKEIPEQLGRFNVQQYEIMQQQAILFSEKLRKGYYLGKVIEEIKKL